MKFSIIIPAFNAEKTISDCLKAALNQDFLDFEVLLVDDCSTDKTIEHARDLPVSIIQAEGKGGPSKARNLGARKAKGEIFLFIDADIIIPPYCLSKIFEILHDSSVNYDGVVGVLSPQAEYKNICSYYKNLYMYYTYSLLPQDVAVFYTSVAAICRNAFFELGGFDENYAKASNEDMEFGERLVSKGFRLFLDKELTVIHLKEYSFFDLIRTAFNRSSTIIKIMLRKHFSRKELSTYQTSPLTFRLSILIVWILMMTLILTFLFHLPSLLYLSVFLIFLTWILNFGFLRFLKQRKGLSSSIISGMILFIDLFSHGAGVLWGILEYFSGKKY